MSASLLSGKTTVAYEIYGSRVSVVVPDPDLAEEVLRRLPIDAMPREPAPGDRVFELHLDRPDGRLAILADGKLLGQPVDLKGALQGLRVQLFFDAIRNARDRLIVHGGAVGHRGGAIVLPGTSMLGKTTLVAALVSAGASYYADDWVMVDGAGWVHPFPTPLYVKDGEDVTVGELGGAVGNEPIEVGVVASLEYQDGGKWNPREVSAGAGMLMLIRNAYGVPVPELAMEAARGAASGALALEGERGEAAEAAAALLAMAERRAAQAGPPVRSR